MKYMGMKAFQQYIRVSKSFSCTDVWAIMGALEASIVPFFQLTLVLLILENVHSYERRFLYVQIPLLHLSWCLKLKGHLAHLVLALQLPKISLVKDVLKPLQRCCVKTKLCYSVSQPILSGDFLMYTFLIQR